MFALYDCFFAYLTHAYFRGFLVVDGRAEIDVGARVGGASGSDVTVVVYHARQILGGKLQAKQSGIKMFQLQFNTGFIPSNATKIHFKT